MKLDLTRSSNREIWRGDLISIFDIEHLVIYDSDTEDYRLLNIENMELTNGSYDIEEMNESSSYKLIAKESELRITYDIGGK
ncbi:hypothetical protein I7E32_18395 [Alcaligenes faecalis]|nr:hypothetical protein [Alcaligenes faecalis]